MRLPVEKVLLGAVLIPWWNRGRFLSALLVPGVLMAVLQLTWVSYPGDLPRWAFWAAWGINVLLYVVFAVVCHRLVLLEGSHQARMPKWSMRETRFTGFAVAIWVLCTVAGWGIVVMVATPILNALGHFFDGLKSDESARAITQVVTWIAKVCGAYILGRLSLVLPAIAVDKPLSLAQSWAATRGNGWRLAVVVGALPWVLDALTNLIYREGATIVESAAFTALCVLTLTIEIAALSLSYKQLAEAAQP